MRNYDPICLLLSTICYETGKNNTSIDWKSTTIAQEVAFNLSPFVTIKGYGCPLFVVVAAVLGEETHLFLCLIEIDFSFASS